MTRLYRLAKVHRYTCPCVIDNSSYKIQLMHHYSPFLFGFSSVFLGATEANRSSSSSSLSNRPLPPPDDDGGGAEDCGFFSVFFSLNISPPASEHIKVPFSFNVNSAHDKILEWHVHMHKCFVRTERWELKFKMILNICCYLIATLALEKIDKLKDVYYWMYQ